MKRWRIGVGILLAGLLGLAPEARGSFGGSGFGGGVPSPRMAQTGFGGMAYTQAGAAGLRQPLYPGGGGMGSSFGVAGMCGPMGIGGMSGGCFGSSMAGYPAHMIGMCGFNCFGGPCGFGGCFGGFPTPTQAYSRWAPSPSKLYFFRTLTIQTPPPNETVLEFILVHYPDRPKLFYYYDPVEKKYFGRYRTGAGPTDCFNLLGLASRKANLRDIPDSAYRATTGGMPLIAHVLRARPGIALDATLQNLKLLRPPESIPDELLGLPPEEPALKKSTDKK